MQKNGVWRSKSWYGAATSSKQVAANTNPSRSARARASAAPDLSTTLSAKWASIALLVAERGGRQSDVSTSCVEWVRVRMGREGG